jgi:4a-hydroxytetrahydrobiopterin dehydratase
MSELLSDTDIAANLAKLPGWQRAGKAIEKVFACKDFMGSMKFVHAVANISNAVDHHPDIGISWDKVTITIWSHDAGGVTARDFDLAVRIEAAS